LDYFHSHKGRLDGLCDQCKQCKSEQRKAEYRQPEERAKIRERQKRYQEENAARLHAMSKRYRDRDGGIPYRELRKQYRKATPEKQKQYGKTKYERHKQAIQKRDKKWRQTEAGKAYRRAYVIKRRAIQREAEGHFIAADIRRQYTNQKGRCYYCQQKAGKDYEIDHVIPLSRGGTNYPSNIVIACRSCNRKKNDKFPHEWPDGGRLL